MNDTIGMLPVFDMSRCDGNSNVLLEYFRKNFGFRRSSDCPIFRYTINGTLGSSVTGSVTLDDRHLVLLLYFFFLLSLPVGSASHIIPGETREFRMTEHMQALAFTYFGVTVSSEAIDNKATENFAIRALLSDRAQVFVEFF